MDGLIRNRPKVRHIEIEFDLLILGHEIVQRVLGDQRLPYFGNALLEPAREVEQFDEALSDCRHAGAGRRQINPPMFPEHRILDLQQGINPAGRYILDGDLVAIFSDGLLHQRGRVRTSLAYLVPIVDGSAAPRQLQRAYRSDRQPTQHLMPLWHCMMCTSSKEDDGLGSGSRQAAAVNHAKTNPARKMINYQGVSLS